MSGGAALSQEDPESPAPFLSGWGPLPRAQGGHGVQEAGSGSSAGTESAGARVSPPASGTGRKELFVTADVRPFGYGSLHKRRACWRRVSLGSGCWWFSLHVDPMGSFQLPEPPRSILGAALGLPPSGAWPFME